MAKDRCNLLATILCLLTVFGSSQRTVAAEPDFSEFESIDVLQAYLTEVGKELERREIEHFKTRAVPKNLLNANLSESTKALSDRELIDILVAGQKVIYCNKRINRCDSRVESLAGILKKSHRDIASAAVALVEAKHATRDGSHWILDGETFADRFEVCEEESFREQPVPGFCSGFLVRDDIVATAGHCIDEKGLKETIFVFGFSLVENSNAPPRISEANVYFGKEIVGRELSSTSLEDWALVRLDRKVSGRTPAALNKGPHVDDAEELCVVGHPVGLPQKYACNAAILSNESEIFFSASLDTYGGNSGSMVFSAKTGMVQGILVRGETDFVYDTENECARSMVCPDHGCRGEDVTRISRILSALESSCRR